MSSTNLQNCPSILHEYYKKLEKHILDLDI